MKTYVGSILFCFVVAYYIDYAMQANRRSLVNLSGSCVQMPRWITLNGYTVRIIVPSDKVLWVCQDGTFYLKSKGTAT